LKIKPKDIILSAVSGVLAALSFPKFGLFFLTWIALIPLFLSLYKKKPKQAFLLGLTAGFAFYAVLLYWIPAVPAHYGGLNMAVSILIYLALVLLLALFWAFFSFFLAIIQNFNIRIAYVLAPLLWVSFEYILTYFLSGFPWGLLGSSQYKNLYFLQLAALTGVYGLSFLLVLFQSLFVLSIRQKKIAYFFSGLLFVLFIHAVGYNTIKETPRSDKTFTAAVLQGNVSSDLNWGEVSPEEKRDLFSQHLELSDTAVKEGASLIIWPEFSVPLCFSCSYGIYQEFKEGIFQFIQRTGSTMLLGTNETSIEQHQVHYYNTALCIQPHLYTNPYYKIHLVPFGEYTPYKKIFFFIERMTHAIGEITPGTQHHLHHYKGIPFGSPICYEIIFPDLVRKFVNKGAKFLVTITNDGWYGRSSAPYQHFGMAVIRAVENRRFLLRSATTGISGIIDPFGRVLIKSQLETKTVLTGSVTPITKKTFYTKYGDVLPFLSLTLSALFLILAVIKRKK
jgi:apolipoprotein N-acyltransferase